MTDALTHRGPDDSGYWYSEKVGIANRRLSIIDIAGGHQPFVSDDGNIVVVQNGEIFNYVELARELEELGIRCKSSSDTEVILRLYEYMGISLLSRLNGMFAIAILDRRESKLYLARDRAGVKPLYWHRDNEMVRFASEIKALCTSGIERRLNKYALHQYLSLNYVPPPQTMIVGVEHVLPGHYLEISDDHQAMTQWWSTEVCEYSPDYDLAWQEQFTDLLDSAVEVRLRADVPVGGFLSGGVDSSAVVATMAKQVSHPVKTFCIGFDDKRFDESQYAELVASRVGADHTTKIVRGDMLRLWPSVTFYNDQPHGDVSFMPTFRVSQLAAADVKLVLTGDGGDELFAGYDKYRDFFDANPDALHDRDVFEQHYFQQLTLFDSKQLTRLYADDMKNYAESRVIDQLQGVLAEQDSLDGINLALYIDFKCLLPGNNLVKPDRMGMANSLEARSPFMDYRFIEWAFSLPGSAKLRDGVTKFVMKQAVTDLVGEDSAFRKKQMFTVPIGEWLRSGAYELAREVLFDSRTTSRGLFNVAEVRRMLDEHRRGLANYTREIRALIALEIWMRIFIDEFIDHPPSWSDIGVTSAQ